MNIQTLTTALLCLAATSGHAAETQLFRIASPAGQVFQEVDRTDSSSTVEAVQATGSVAAKSMFLLRGSCALMKERDKQAFRIERLSRQPMRFILHFVPPESAGKEPADRAMDEHTVVGAAQCGRIEALMGRVPPG